MTYHRTTAYDCIEYSVTIHFSVHTIVNNVHINVRINVHVRLCVSISVLISVITSKTYSFYEVNCVSSNKCLINLINSFII